MTILLTGGLGYIGSNLVTKLLPEYKVVIVDNLSNSNLVTLNFIEEFGDISFYYGDILDTKLMRDIFSENEIDLVIHLAGVKSVTDSIELPIEYYKTNISGSISLFEVMKEFNVNKIIFSSSASVYSNNQELPIKETAKVNPSHPYGKSKLYIENILKDISFILNWDVTILRYANPIGSDETGVLCDLPKVPTNLMSVIQGVHRGNIEHVNIFGKNFDTIDGTGVRDYIHILDLVEAHKVCISSTGYNVYNVGTGLGISVLELIERYSEVNDIIIPYEYKETRVGEAPEIYLDPTLIKSERGWEAKLKLSDMCKLNKESK